MSHPVTPFSLKEAPALIEKLLPVQKLSVESFKEQMAGSGKTLTALGSYWKGRKPLILNKACILGCLLPATDNPKRDLEIFEMLMAMDQESFVVRWPRRPKPREILEKLEIANVADFFMADPPMLLPQTSPVDWSKPELKNVKVSWRDDVSELQRRQIEAQLLPKLPYRELVDEARRPEEVADTVHAHIWDTVNKHLGSCATSFPELVEQLGIMRFGHKPRVGDTFCGSGQIPFEAARLGCDVVASDLNPIACMLAWGALHIVGGTEDQQAVISLSQERLVQRVRNKIEELGVESDGKGWQAKVFLYCLEARCPQSGWLVPLLPSRIVSKPSRVILDLIPDSKNKRYSLVVRNNATDADLKDATKGTLGRESQYDEASLVHQVNGVEYRTKISTLRGDFENTDGTQSNRLRMWTKSDFKALPSDVYQERLYAIQWMRPKKGGKKFEYEFRSVGEADLKRERVVEEFLGKHLAEWQQRGWIPDMRIEVGGPPRYQGLDLIRARGWTCWHHVFNPRQLLLAGLIRANATATDYPNVAYCLNYLSKLSRWDPSRDNAQDTFYNQALNTIYNYACRSSSAVLKFLIPDLPIQQLRTDVAVKNCNATAMDYSADVFVTDPPYGDAVKYEEILDFFIAWLRKNPPPEFSDWVWDSRRALAIKGEDEDFRRNMVSAYKRMAERMPEHGLQVIMFTHQDGDIWADMANIVWASGLQVTAAWYVATETDSALRSGSNVKGTIILILRKRQGELKTTRDDLAWDIQEEVEHQVHSLTGLNQETKDIYRDENLFEDADIQMAGYAAALRVLTRYATIDGRDMAAEAIRPRIKSEKTFVDGLIEFAVGVANQCLVPPGIPKPHWDRLHAAERFYIKLLDMEARGLKTLDNYQNFAKAFKVQDFRALMASEKANAARLKSAVEFGRGEMSEGSELHQSLLRAILYAMMELVKDVDSTEVLTHLSLNVENYYDSTTREMIVELSDHMSKKLEPLRPEEASAARVLRDAVRNQKFG